MDKLLSFTPEPFPELDRETEYDELDPLAECETEEVDEEARRSRRPRSSAKAPRRSVTTPKMRPRAPSRATGLRVMPLRQRPKLMPRPLPMPALRAVAIPFIPPLRIMRPDLEPPPPRDIQRPEESRRTEQAGSEGSGSPPTAQPAEEPASEHVRWVQDCLNRALGISLPTDGVMGRETRSAVRLFQERRGLNINGWVGPETEEALKTACSPTSAPASAQGAAPIAAYQSEMIQAIPSASPLCNRRTDMNSELSFWREPFGEMPELEEFDTFALETPVSWSSETGRASPQRIRWIQESLNKILPSRLKIDEIMGPETRSTIRSFQKRQGLIVDGVVGPRTEAAIQAALGRTLSQFIRGPQGSKSGVRVAFEEALTKRDWQAAYFHLNGLSMTEMLLAIEEANHQGFDDLWNRRSQFEKRFNIPRIQYARHVVLNRMLPQMVVGDLKETGQVDVAAKYIADKIEPRLSTIQQDAMGAILQECSFYGINDKSHVSYVLASAMHESRMGESVRELWGPTEQQKGYEGRQDLGNKMPGDGYRFRGRGFVQITGRTNYEKYSKYLNEVRHRDVDLVKNPDQASEFTVAAIILVHGVKYGIFRSGHALSRYGDDCRYDFVKARNTVNADIAENGQQIARIAVRYRRGFGGKRYTFQ